LLFLLEPMAGRALLPAFGGTPQVWAVTLVFFQAALLAGYAIAYAAVRALGPRQPLAQLALVAIPVGALPLALPGRAQLADGPPELAVLASLAVTVGLPFVVLATTAPVLGAWFGRLRPDLDPYALYAAGNAGSFGALLAYPFVVERVAGLSGQAAAWTVGYLVFAVVALACAAATLRADVRTATPPTSSVASGEVPVRTRVAWLVLAAIPAALVVAVTTEITTDLAPMPLLWVAPLALYLATFVAAFAPQRDRWLPWAAGLAPGAVLAIVLARLGVPGGPLVLVIGVHLGGFALLGLALHGRLAALRPDPSRLTGFYLHVAAGGVLGGAAAALLAPQLFDRLLEYPLAVAAAVLVLPAVPAGAKGRVGLGVAAALLVAIALVRISEPGGVLFALFAAGTLALARRPLVFAAVAVVLLALGSFATPDALLRERSFHGVYRVAQDLSGRRALFSGTAVHGIQRVAPADARMEPISYYHRGGPVGSLFAALPDGPRNVGVVGLGIGELVAYGRSGDSFTFAEIDPVVVEIARDSGLFTFLRDTPATVDIAVADGRLALADVPPATFDLLVLDAFSSSAVPVHLLTREALALDLERVRPGGLLAVHVSSRYADLEPVVAAAANELGASVVARSDVTDPARAGDEDGSDWVVLARDGDALMGLRADPRWRDARRSPGSAAWTDDHADVASVIRWGR
jgi:hypothetical protein